MSTEHTEEIYYPSQLVGKDKNQNDAWPFKEDGVRTYYPSDKSLKVIASYRNGKKIHGQTFSKKANIIKNKRHDHTR